MGDFSGSGAVDPVDAADAVGAAADAADAAADGGRGVRGSPASIGSVARTGRTVRRLSSPRRPLRSVRVQHRAAPRASQLSHSDCVSFFFSSYSLHTYKAAPSLGQSAAAVERPHPSHPAVSLSHWAHSPTFVRPALPQRYQTHQRHSAVPDPVAPPGWAAPRGAIEGGTSVCHKAARRRRYKAAMGVSRQDHCCGCDRRMATPAGFGASPALLVSDVTRYPYTRLSGWLPAAAGTADGAWVDGLLYRSRWQSPPEWVPTALASPSSRPTGQTSTGAGQARGGGTLRSAPPVPCVRKKNSPPRGSYTWGTADSRGRPPVRLGRCAGRARGAHLPVELCSTPAAPPSRGTPLSQGGANSTLRGLPHTLATKLRSRGDGAACSQPTPLPPRSPAPAPARCGPMLGPPPAVAPPSPFVRQHRAARRRRPPPPLHAAHQRALVHKVLVGAHKDGPAEAGEHGQLEPPEL